MTQLQRLVMRKVFACTRLGPDSWYRAAGNGERVTLASLFKRGALVRRAWRGKEGEPDAANEYRISPDLMNGG